jgi:hypothetical protein
MGSVTPYETASGRRYRVRYRQPNKSQTDKRGFKTKREAELYLASIELTKSRGEYVSATQSRLTIGQTAQEWISSQVQLKPSTRAGYEAIVRTQIDPKWGPVPLGELSHAAVQTWISDQSQRVSAATVRSYHRVLSMILKSGSHGSIEIGGSTSRMSGRMSSQADAGRTATSCSFWRTRD